MDGIAVRRMEVPNAVLLGQVKEAIREGHTATINVKGYSMRPFLEHCRDKVRLASFTDLKVGDAVQFAIERLRSVRTLASEIGLAYSRKFTTKTDRESRVIEVTRVS